MEKETLSSGKRPIKSLSRRERLDLYASISQNYTPEMLCDIYNIDISDFEHTFSRILKHLFRPTVYESPLGFKNSSYEDEEFMLNGYPKYSWKDLSKNEKKFYEEYGKRRVKRKYSKTGIARRYWNDSSLE